MCTIMSGVKRLVVADSTENLNRLKINMNQRSDLMLKSPPSINTLMNNKMFQNSQKTF